MSASIADEALEPAPILVPEREAPARPYRGIAPFRFIDQPIFFGRMAESRRLLRLVTMFRGVLLYGDSGSGKSSLLNARFVPEAIADGFLPERIRVQPKPGAEIVVERISVRERGMPPFLSSNLVATDEASRIVLSCTDLRERVSHAGVKGYPLLIFDQFEEFVTLFEIAPRSTEERAQAAEAQEQVLDLLSHFLVASQTPVKLLFAFREDYFTKLQKLFVRCRDLTDQSLRLLPPGLDELPLTIRGPFEKNPGVFPNPLSDSVCAQLEAELRERSSGGLQNPTEGQIAGLVLWLAAERENLLATRKVQGLLEDYLVQQLEALPPNEHAPAVALLSCLVTDAGTRNIVSRSDLIARVTESENAADEAVASTLDSLVQNTGLVRQEFRDRTAFYEIISEFLVPWIREQKAGRALEESRREAEERMAEERREAEQKLALQSAEADRRRAEDLAVTLRRVRLSRAALATLFFLLLVVAATAWWQARRAGAEKNAANAAREAAAHEKESAELAEDAARTALDQKVKTETASFERLKGAMQALTATQLKASTLLEEASKLANSYNISEGDWTQFSGNLEDVLESTKAEQQQIETSVQLTQREAASAKTVPGWSLYGRLNEAGSWTEHYFHHTASASAIPVAGDVIVADTFVNVRAAANGYDLAQRSWQSQQIIGVIAPSQRLKVNETRKVTGPPGDAMVRFWIRGEPAP